MTILYVLHTAKSGGAVESLRVFLEQWQQRQTMRVLLAMPNDGPHFREFQKAGYRVFELPPGLQKRPTNIPSFLQAAQKVLLWRRQLRTIIQRQKVDIVHCNSTTAHLCAGGAAHSCGIKNVWHVRDLTPLPKPLARLLSNQADAVIAISKTVSQDLQKQGIPSSKIHLISNTLAPEKWTPAAPALPGITDAFALDTFIFGCVGQLVSWKNQSVFIEAAAKMASQFPHQKIGFAIIGSDPWNANSDYRQQLLTKAQNTKLGKNLIFFPHQTDNRAALASCHCLVHCARREPFGRVIIEAMALQKPVIAFDSGGPGEIISSHKDGILVPPQQGATGIYEAMQKVLLSPQLRTSLGKAARQTVQSQYNAENGAVRIEHLYQALSE